MSPCCKIWRDGNGHACGVQHQYLSCFYRDPRIPKRKNFDPEDSLKCYVFYRPLFSHRSIVIYGDKN